jgi:hypothetical protein
MIAGLKTWRPHMVDEKTIRRMRDDEDDEDIVEKCKLLNFNKNSQALNEKVSFWATLFCGGDICTICVTVPRKG